MAVGIMAVLVKSWEYVGKRASYDSDVTTRDVYLGSHLGSCERDDKSL